MRAVVITHPGGSDVLELREIEPPSAPTADQVRLRVHAAGLNRADLLQREGKYPPPPGYPKSIPGLEFAGEVEAIGEAVRSWKLGDRVFGITGGGAQAELVLTTESNLARVPDELSWTEAGGMPETYITAHDALFTRAALQVGERVLIHAVASGVGTAALQLARSAGAIVYGTSRTAAKLERIQSQHLDSAICVGDDPRSFVEAVQTLTNGAGVDVILDLVGGAYFPLNLEAIASRARIVCVGTTAGSKTQLDLGMVLRKRATIIGTMLRGRSLAEKAEATRRFAAHVLPLVFRGSVRPIIEQVYPVEQVRAAYQHLESNRAVGKIVLSFK
jgi:NADPH2:quinone reductase